MADKVADAPLDGEQWLAGHSIFVRHLIVRRDGNRLNLLTLPTRGGDMLPVFSTELAARTFLRFGLLSTGWQVRESTAGELISLLMGHIADVDLVSLDPPLAVAFDEGAPVELTSKKDFISALMREPLLMSL